MEIIEKIIKEFGVNRKHVENLVKMLDEGDTVPFIARYRKEQTGEMKDETIRDLAERLEYLRNIETRKEEVKRLIDEQDKLTKELESDIDKAETLQRLDDLYRPYRKKRRTRATIAKEKGLESLADIIFAMVAGGGILTMADSLSITLVTITTMFIIIDWRLTILAILPLPLLAFSSRYLGKMLHVRFRDAQAAFSKMNNKVQESLQGIKVIKTFGQEKEDITEFNEQTKNILNKNREVYKVDSIFDPVLSLIIGISYTISIIVGGSLIINNEITVGEFVTFISYLGMLVWPMFAIGRLFNIVERGSASYERVELLLNENSSIIERDGAVNEAINGEFTFDIDSFTYPMDNELALENVHFSAKKGETIGIVGKTGAGKSTILKLLLREYDNYNGEIQFGNRDIRDYTLDALLENIGYVPQNNYLFSASIRDNIRFSNPNLSQSEVEEAAVLADIHEDILEMPEGYDTETGERGVSLSGGQQQRVSIARAIAKNPELMILDDSLSAVDAKTEEEILSSLRNIRDGQTTIIVAHRISSLMHADEIIVLEDGKIIERGKHEELVSQDGWYNDMYNQQQLEEVPSGTEGA